jgi:hypothetical protein
LYRISLPGRFGKVGIAINLASNSTMHIIEKIQNHFGKQIKKLDPSEIDKLQKWYLKSIINKDGLKWSKLFTLYLNF